VRYEGPVWETAAYDKHAILYLLNPTYPVFIETGLNMVYYDRNEAVKY